MGSSKVITLITDFGTKDTYVGQMKGVIMYITNIITEKGIIKKPFKRYIHRLF